MTPWGKNFAEKKKKKKAATVTGASQVRLESFDACAAVRKAGRKKGSGGKKWQKNRLTFRSVGKNGGIDPESARSGRGGPVVLTRHGYFQRGRAAGERKRAK